MQQHNGNYRKKPLRASTESTRFIWGFGSYNHFSFCKNKKKKSDFPQ